MSNLPRIKGAVIDRRTLDILEMVEKEIATFRGLRHLWANAVARGGTADDLMAEQERVLWAAIGQAMTLCAHAFPGKSPHKAFPAMSVQMASRPPSDKRRVLAMIVAHIDDDYEREWVVAYYDRDEPEGWWAESGMRIHPSLWCEIAKPPLPNASGE